MLRVTTGVGVGVQQAIELASVIQLGQVVETTDMEIANKDLRYGSTPGFVQHLLP